MPSIFEQVLWVLKKAGRSVKKTTQYYIAHPSEAWEDLSTYARENPIEFTITCLLIGGGILAIVLPPLIGFGAAGPILGSIAAGWQSGIGAVAAGSLFAVLQAMGMTGAFTGIGAGMIALGAQTPLTSGLLQSAIRTSRDLDNPQIPWYLHIDHTNPNNPLPMTTRRLLLTNSKATHDMVWKSLDPSNNSATVKEHALSGFDVRICFIEGPRTEPEDTRFCERFKDHETECNTDCECTEEIEDV